jgi:hypothetical protein
MEKPEELLNYSAISLVYGYPSHPHMFVVVIEQFSELCPAI